MGKHEPMSAKAIANRIKAKGLQKIKYYCEMCKKQCRDDNGFKCHIMSETHQRQALIVSQNPEKFVSEFSNQFMEGFLYLLRTRYRTKRILANTVFQEYIKERDHIHMNGTRWTSLTEFANWLSEQGIVKVDESERGVMVTYIDRDPETIKRQELEAKRAQQAKEAAERNQREIDEQMEAAKKIMRDHQRDAAAPLPIPIVQVHVPSTSGKVNEKNDGEHKNNSIEDRINNTDPNEEQLGNSTESNKTDNLLERPLFKVQAISLKTTAPTGYKPPPPKKRVSSKKLGPIKRAKVT